VIDGRGEIEGVEDREGALNEGVLKLGGLTDRLDREPIEGSDGLERLNDGVPPPRLPNDARGPDERELLPPGERETDARWAHASVGTTNANTAIARPRIRTASWGENIDRPRCRFERR